MRCFLWKGSLCALKSFKIGFIGERSNMCGHIFLGLNLVRCEETASLYPHVFMDFSITLEAI